MSVLLYPHDTGSRGRAPFRGRAVPYDDQPANDHWAKHYANELVLRQHLTTATSASTKADLRRQLVVCQRKQDHWQRHRNWDASQAARDAQAAKAASRQSSLAKAPAS